MPSLKAIISGDARPLEKEFNRTTAIAANWSRGMRGAMDAAFDLGTKRRPSTLFNKNEVKSAAQEYADFWNKALTDRDIESASRSIQARRLRRSRKESAQAEAKQAADDQLAAEIEAASRAIRARRLWRERAERREAAGGHKITWASGMGEVAVIGRELASGNWSRLPTSISVMIQRFNLLKYALHPVTLSLAAIAGSVYLFHKRVQNLTEDLAAGITRVFKGDHIPKYLSKTNEIALSYRNITDEIRRQVEAYDSVTAAAERLGEITKEQFEFERKKLALQKEAALARATSETERKAIERRFSDAGLALNKQERDQQVKELQDRQKNLMAEAQAKFAAVDRILKTSGIQGAEREKQNLENLKKANEAAEEYFSKKDEGGEESSAHTAEKDRKTIEELTRKKEYEDKLAAGPHMNSSEFPHTYGFSETDAARLKAAQERLAGHRQSQKDYNAFLDAGDDRARLRQRVEDLKKAGEKSAEEAAAIGKSLPDKIAANKRKDKEEQELAEMEQNMPKRHQLAKTNVNNLQQVGAYAMSASLIEVNKQQLKHIQSIDNKLSKNGGGGGGNHRPFGGVKH